MSQKITVTYGDGIGPEIMKVVLDILRKAGVSFQEDVIEIGEKLYKQGYLSGIKPEDWHIISRNKVFLKAPITTPQGGGFKSLNVKIRKSFGLFANVRPVQSLHPYVATKFPNMNVVIIRENEEDLYAGIEHRQTHEVFQCLKLMSVPGCQKIVRYAFEYAKQMGRKKITCMTKDNIMKLTDGTFHKIFNQIAKEYPDIEDEHWIIDIGAAKFSTSPLDFDVILLPNLYGDILSDISAQIAGSVGIGGSGNIGVNHAMFEAIHGSAPRRAGQNVANPSGLLNAALLMLHHIGENNLAEKIQNAWLKTIEDGVHTYDIYNEKTSQQKVSTTDFGKAVIENMGAKPKKLTFTSIPKEYKPIKVSLSKTHYSSQEKVLDGMDVFVCDQNRNPEALAEKLKIATRQNNFLKLSYITNRGIKVYPDPNPATFCTDHWRCRFLKIKDSIDFKCLISLLQDLASSKIEVIKTENLYSFSGEKNYSQIG
ncbi:MAG: NADP-dependent isocitrate dehydrogenase [Bdellovibrionales bacterium]|nr:NADP-dependent isocitrate dehydrogenase [Bdellovibrionales bacterium]